MEEDLKENGYRFLYILTFILVFCVIPLIFILANSDINRKETVVNCANTIEVKEVLVGSGKASWPDQYKYKLADGTEYYSTVKYKVGDKVCKY